jgi:hypothetical protein
MPTTILVSSRDFIVIWQTWQGAGRSCPHTTAAVSNLIAILVTPMAVVNNREGSRPSSAFEFGRAATPTT